MRLATTSAAAAVLVGGVSVAPASAQQHHVRVTASTLSVCQGKLSNQVRLRASEGATIGAISQCASVRGGGSAGSSSYDTGRSRG